MTHAEQKTFEQARKHQAKRLAAENTWLRHSLMEMQDRVAAMADQLTDLEIRTKALKKSLADLPTNSPANTEPKSRNKQ